MRGFYRACVSLIVFAVTAAAANAQLLLNPGFETASTNLVYPPDANGVIITNTSAASWTVLGGQIYPNDPTNILRLAFRTSTNSPASGTYTEADFGQSFLGINNSGSTNTAHSGGFALRAFGPFTNLCCQASGAYQAISSNNVPAISNNTIWVLSGSVFNWSGDPMQNIGGGVVNFGELQIQFYDGASNYLGQADSAQFGTNLAVNVWSNISVTATAPFGTAEIRAYALHVGMSAALGSVFFDDLSLTNIGVAPPPLPTPTLEPAGIRKGDQVCWPTVVNTSYQPQYSDDNVLWVNIIATNAAQQLLPGDGTTNCIFSTSHKFYRVLATPATPASLLNPGFETQGAAETNAASWTQFNDGFRTGTNATSFGITAHNNSAYAMQTYGPFGPGLDASGAYQDLAASPGQNWRLTGYCLNWQNDQLSGSNAFGRADIEFLDSTNGVIQTVPGPAFGQDTAFPIDTWQYFEVDATNAPTGTAAVRVRVAHFGQVDQTGSAWWDDLVLSQPTGGSSTITPTSQPAVQVYWPTASPYFGIKYQVQSITNLVYTNLPPVNVLSNASFEADAVTNAADNLTVTGWSKNGGWTSSSPQPTRTGIGAFKHSSSGGFVPVAWQTFAASPGQVWDFQGYMLQTNTAALTGAAFGLLKIVWLNVSNATLQPVAGDTNLVGTAVTGTFAGIESAHLVAGSAKNVWLFREARATAPPNCTQVQVLPIFVPNGASGTVYFDDLSLSQGGTSFGWKNFGPVYPGNGNTNSVFDPINSNQQKFYRVTTP
jgi:hypothetical protein